MNLTAIEMAEAQAWACYHKMQNGSLSVRPENPRQPAAWQDAVSRESAKFSRRRKVPAVPLHVSEQHGSRGLGCSTAADAPGRSGNGTGYRFFDTVAIGAPQPNFGYDVHRARVPWCTLPPYVSNKIQIEIPRCHSIIPFGLHRGWRAQHAGRGKSMAQSFYKLCHPVALTSGLLERRQAWRYDECA